MLFSSFTFLCFFLPAVVLLYYIVHPALRNTFLLIASLFFYGLGQFDYLLVMIMVVCAVYVGALLTATYWTQLIRKIFLVLTVSFVIGILFYFKYMGFVVENIQSFIEFEPIFSEIILPIGISFYTFQALSYLFDVYYGKVLPQKNFFHLLLYISLFPQLVAGPIVRYADIAKQLIHRHHSLLRLKSGFERFVIGLGKKVVLADTFAVTADKIFDMAPEQLSVSIAWVGMILYSLQIYFDFSGYSDMAIGLGRMFGFKFLENFNYPYVSRSITEFWRRWHISLSSWFKLYVYIPLGGNKKGFIRTLVNLGFVFLLTGMWHGAAWTFVLWGILHGFFIILEKIIKKIHLPFHSFFAKTAHIYTLLVVMIGWVLFRADTVVYAQKYILLLFGLIETYPDYGIGYYIGRGHIFLACVGIFASFGGFKRLISVMCFKGFKIISAIYVWSVLAISVCFLTAGGYNPFIYFSF